MPDDGALPQWLRPILKDRSVWRGLGLGFVISTIALFLIEILFRTTGVYFTPICIVFSMVAALACGFIPSIFVTVLLTFSTDYLYIPPIGSILDTPEGIEHFSIIMLSCVTVSLLTTTLRTTIRRLNRAKLRTDTANRILAEKTIALELSQSAVTKLNSELERRGQSAIEASRLKSQFLANMSHEIRTPINGVIGMTELLSQTQLEPKQKRYTEAISNSSTLLLNLINTILDLSKVEAGRLELEILPFDFVQVLDETRAAFGPLTELRGLELNWNVDLENDRYFAGDPARLRQIFNNLIGNALKFTPRGSISVTTNILNTNALNATIQIKIEDTGIGMPSKTVARLFQVFSQGDSSTSRKYGGSGLGLAISKQLADLMGASLTVESTEGVGSAFFFTLTLTRISKDHVVKTIAPQAPQAKATTAQRNQSRILLAEDNALNQEITSTILRNAGFKVDVVETGHDVLAAIPERDYICIIMDCQMPLLDGYETTRILRSQKIEIPIVALTANAFQADRDRCFEAGMTAYLSKPAFADQLLPVLDRYVLDVATKSARQEDRTATAVLDKDILDRLSAIDENGDMALLKTLLKMYAERSPLALDELASAMQSGSAEAIRKSAHALRSSHANVGATNVVAILEEIEHHPETHARAESSAQTETVRKLGLEIQLAQNALERYIDQTHG